MMRFRQFPFVTLATFSFICAFFCYGELAIAKSKPRARDLGVSFDGDSGTNNAIGSIPTFST
jgi:hypothetical protein